MFLRGQKRPQDLLLRLIIRIRTLRILAIDDPEISQKFAFLGYWHKCITCQVATNGSILKFESKWLMSGQTSCIASILNRINNYLKIQVCLRGNIWHKKGEKLNGCRNEDYWNFLLLEMIYMWSIPYEPMRNPWNCSTQYQKVIKKWLIQLKYNFTSWGKYNALPNKGWSGQNN